MLLLIPSRKQCTGVDVSLCSLSIRLDSEVLTHPEIPIPMGTCPGKAGWPHIEREYVRLRETETERETYTYTERERENVRIIIHRLWNKYLT